MKFPKTIYFVNKTLDDMEKYANNWKKLNPEYEIKLYDHKMCEKFLLENFGQLHKDIYVFIKDGPIKADFWRVCILYIYGGVYSDIDNEPLYPINKFLEKDIDFLTCNSFLLRFKYNPNFIIAKKGNFILKKCIDWYINMYTNKIPYKYWDWSIMKAFTDELHVKDYNKKDGIYYLDNTKYSNDIPKNIKIQLLKECIGENYYNDHNIYNNIRIFNNRYSTWDAYNHCFKK